MVDGEGEPGAQTLLERRLQSVIGIVSIGVETTDVLKIGIHDRTSGWKQQPPIRQGGRNADVFGDQAAHPVASGSDVSNTQRHSRRQFPLNVKVVVNYRWLFQKVVGAKAIGRPGSVGEGLGIDAR